MLWRPTAGNEKAFPFWGFEKSFFCDAELKQRRSANIKRSPTLCRFLDRQHTLVVVWLLGRMNFPVANPLCVGLSIFWILSDTQSGVPLFLFSQISVFVKGNQKMTTNERVPRMMTIRETARTGILPETALRRLAAENRLPALKVGNRVLVNFDLLVEQLNALGGDADA